MKTDETIEQERAALAELIGPTRAEWYADACKWEATVGKATEDSELALIWIRRYREVARELGSVVEAILSAKDDGHVFGSRPCATCRRVSEAILQPYGCDLFRQQKARS
jgi:hypothetical protein